MSRRHTIILVLVALALTAFSIALSRRDSRDWRASRARRLFPFPWQDTVAITIVKPDGQTLRFEKPPRGEWQIRLDENLSDALSYRAVDEFSALATLTWREPMKDGRPPDPSRATTLSAVSAAGQTVSLAFGDTANNLRAVRVEGDDAVYGVNQDLLKFLDWPAKRWRNLNLAAAGSGRRPKKITLCPAGGNPDLRIVLERTDAGWRQTEPVAWPVDEARLDLLLRWLDRLRAESIEAEQSADLPWFGFGPEAAWVEADYDGAAGPARRRVEFGGEAENGRVYVREAGRKPIFAISRETLAEISLDAASVYPAIWRNFYRLRTVNAVGEELPMAVTLERLLPKPAKLTIEQIRDREGARWRGKLEENGTVREFAVEPPDPAEPMCPLTALVTGLSSLRIKAFLADVAPGPETIKWTAYPAWRFACKKADGTAGPVLTLYARDAEGNLPPGAPFAEGDADPREMPPPPGSSQNAGIAFSLGSSPAVMEMHGDLAYLLCLPPYRYQSRRLIDADPRLWTRVEATAGDSTEAYNREANGVNEQWWRDGERREPLMDDNNLFVALLLELSRLRAEGFVADADREVGEFGLDRPAITAIVYVSKLEGREEAGDVRLFKLSLGGPAETPGGSRYARLNDSGPVFLVPERLAAALEKVYH